MPNHSEPALIEIVERVPNTSDQVDAESRTCGYIKPNEVRINGIPLAVPQGEPIKVHSVVIDSDDVLKVTLTLFARRIVMGAEPI